ncbi:zinc transporter ZitB [Bacillus sp. FJAT-27264]|uniref:cation diffusion facilitator family transporter n=1 Tax=Paenibacillus sp. (strain DSM 101736 / FJAT-27264) TaxID=1850362 RepID=UPI000807FF9F|nr:cation diffusion facilitator family transporter [Bacillus sp. FJAT-27264]OBZ10582.1 zinc transporter ZitB [Bacillus sp. FJAT-27264]
MNHHPQSGRHSQEELGHSHHDHTHDHHGHSHAPNNKKGLLIALIITSGIMFVEFFGGLFTHSLALLSDAGHMLSDIASLALSLVAMIFAAKPASSKNTYGFYRFEVMAALFNGVMLFVIAGLVIREAWQRLFEPPVVASGSMIIIAAIGLLANLVSAWVLIRKGDVKDNLNVRSAYLHVIGDALGSVGAIVAGVIMQLFSWYAADPIISVLVALLILKSAWGVLRHSFHILMEGTPAALNNDQVRQTLLQISGVADVHDLHIWTITSGLNALSCHLRIEEDRNPQEILQRAVNLIEDKYNISHTTIQIEISPFQHGELKV